MFIYIICKYFYIEYLYTCYCLCPYFKDKEGNFEHFIVQRTERELSFVILYFTVFLIIITLFYYSSLLYYISFLKYFYYIF